MTTELHGRIQELLPSRLGDDMLLRLRVPKDGLSWTVIYSEDPSVPPRSGDGVEDPLGAENPEVDDLGHWTDIWVRHPWKTASPLELWRWAAVSVDADLGPHWFQFLTERTCTKADPLCARVRHEEPLDVDIVTRAIVGPNPDRPMCGEITRVVWRAPQHDALDRWLRLYMRDLTTDRPERSINEPERIVVAALYDMGVDDSRLTVLALDGEIGPNVLLRGLARMEWHGQHHWGPELRFRTFTLDPRFPWAFGGYVKPLLG